MGLSERKTKQKLGADPRNLAWANGKSALIRPSLSEPREPQTDWQKLDNSRFGQQYLEKFGWTAGSGSGLGASGQGRLSHISVAQKLNLLGIGGNNGNNGDVSWTQNRDYEMMLKRLNTSGGDDDGDEGEECIKVSMIPDGFVRAVEGKVTDEMVATNGVSIEEVHEKEQKRLRKERKRKEKAAAKANASIENGGTSLGVAPSPTIMDAAPTVSSSRSVPSSAKPRRGLAYVAFTTSRTRKMTDFMFPISHRAKFRASKQLASSNPAALIEILGISQSAIPSEAPSQTQSALDTPVDSPSPAPTPTTTIPQHRHAADDQIRTSTTSVADYFAAKMKARQQVAVTVTPTVLQPDESIPVPEPEAQDPSEGMTLVDGIVAGKKKEKKRKRKDAVEKAETHDDRIELHTESKKRKKKKQKME